jgi:hypothetical protein
VKHNGRNESNLDPITAISRRFARHRNDDDIGFTFATARASLAGLIIVSEPEGTGNHCDCDAATDTGPSPPEAIVVGSFLDRFLKRLWLYSFRLRDDPGSTSDILFGGIPDRSNRNTQSTSKTRTLSILTRFDRHPD